MYGMFYDTNLTPFDNNVRGEITNYVSYNVTLVNNLFSMKLFLENIIIIKNVCYWVFQPENTTFDTFNLYAWWYAHKDHFPNVFRLFLNTVCTPAASTTAERSFSTTGTIISEKRSRLLPEVVNDIMLLRNALD